MLERPARRGSIVLAFIVRHRRAHRRRSRRHPPDRHPPRENGTAIGGIDTRRTTPPDSFSTSSAAAPGTRPRCSVNHRRRALVHRRLEPRERRTPLPTRGRTSSSPAAWHGHRPPAGDRPIPGRRASGARRRDRHDRRPSTVTPTRPTHPRAVVAQVPAPEPVPAPAVRPVSPAANRQTQNSKSAHSRRVHGDQPGDRPREVRGERAGARDDEGAERELEPRAVSDGDRRDPPRRGRRSSRGVGAPAATFSAKLTPEKPTTPLL